MYAESILIYSLRLGEQQLLIAEDTLCQDVWERVLSSLEEFCYYQNSQILRLFSILYLGRLWRLARGLGCDWWGFPWVFFCLRHSSWTLFIGASLPFRRTLFCHLSKSNQQARSMQIQKGTRNLIKMYFSFMHGIIVVKNANQKWIGEEMHGNKYAIF